MIQINNVKITMAVALATAILGLAVPAIANPTAGLTQRKGGGGGGGGQQRNSSPPPRRASPPPPPPQAHARREGVRTQTFVSRTQGGAFQRQPPVRQAIPPRPPANVRNGGQAQPVRRAAGPIDKRVVAQRTFTKTAQGRRYDNGLALRKGVVVNGGWQAKYFRKGHMHFPFYRPTFVRGRCFISPFGFYFGVCVPYIDVSVCSIFPPAVTFIDVPIYQGNQCTGYQNADDGNMINDPNLDQEEPGLNNALDELTETFQGGNIDGLVSLINPNMKIAIFERGQYQYSMSADDFTDMTRDAIQSTQTVSFNIQYLHQRTPGVFCVSGQNVYKDPTGATRVVYVSYVLQDIGGLWTLTQVGTSPDVVQNL